MVKKISVAFVLLIISILGLSSCESGSSKTGASSTAETMDAIIQVEDLPEIEPYKDMEGIHKLLIALTEYPENDLYVPVEPTVIGIGVEETQDNRNALTEEENYKSWKEAFGTLFADNCFEAFYKDANRTIILDMGYMFGLISRVTDIKAEEEANGTQSFVLVTEMEDSEGVFGEYKIRWTVTYSSDGSGSIQKVELANDDGCMRECMEHRNANKKSGE